MRFYIIILMILFTGCSTAKLRKLSDSETLAVGFNLFTSERPGYATANEQKADATANIEPAYEFTTGCQTDGKTLLNCPNAPKFDHIALLPVWSPSQLSCAKIEKPVMESDEFTDSVTTDPNFLFYFLVDKGGAKVSENPAPLFESTMGALWWHADHAYAATDGVFTKLNSTDRDRTVKNAEERSRRVELINLADERMKKGAPPKFVCERAERVSAHLQPPIRLLKMCKDYYGWSAFKKDLKSIQDSGIVE